jgi:hypothetical protein
MILVDSFTPLGVKENTPYCNFSYEYERELVTETHHILIEKFTEMNILIDEMGANSHTQTYI